jgi:YfiH family protein
MWTEARGTGIGVRTADCVPVLIANPAVPVCAVVHAGWRGLAAGIIGETVRGLGERFGSIAVRGIVAAAGPSARNCCYEIGEEVADHLRPLPGGKRFLSHERATGKWKADLTSLALEGLFAAGIPLKNLEITGPCTICSPSFHSYRREKSLTGRQLSFIYITDHSSQLIFPGQQETE